ncbi:Guanine nucleotide exchange factor VAV2 [Sarcoptes scabiei]|nr:Guanine nucleotide exchange factor VAV2 [Sarcoptes scabiei]
MISLPDVNGAVVGQNLRDGRRTQSRVQDTLKNLLRYKTATGILMIELHHLGGGLPDPDGSHQQAGSITGLEKKAKSHRNRLYRIAVLYCSRIFENYHHRWLKLEEQQQYQYHFAAQNQYQTGKMAAMAATYLYQTRINGAKQTRGGAAVSVALFQYQSGNFEANHHRFIDYNGKFMYHCHSF